MLAEFQLPFNPDSRDADIECIYIRRGAYSQLLRIRVEGLLGTYGLFPLNDMTCELRNMYFLREITAWISVAKYGDVVEVETVD